jgi:hypothetical protein
MVVVEGQEVGERHSAPTQAYRPSGHFFRSRFDSPFDPFALQRTGHKKTKGGRHSHINQT